MGSHNELMMSYILQSSSLVYQHRKISRINISDFDAVFYNLIPISISSEFIIIM
jgi:hypothetical protein